MKDIPRGEVPYLLTPERRAIFDTIEREPNPSIRVYQLGERFEGLPSSLAKVTMLDVTKITGAHYGVGKTFPLIIRDLEEHGTRVGRQRVKVSPETAILFEASTGNGWVAFSNAAERLGYEHVIVMPKGLPAARYRHPQGRKVKIVSPETEDYALGMPGKQMELLGENPGRLNSGEKIYVTPNHAISGANRTVQAMSEIGKQLIEHVGTGELTAVISMGNGASLYSIGKYLKEHTQAAQVIATESFNFGGGFDRYARLRGYRSYGEVFGIDPGNPNLMQQFNAYGTNAPIGVELPLQRRAITDVIDFYRLFIDDATAQSYNTLRLDAKFNEIVAGLPNYDRLPLILYETFGNSSLGNIAVAKRFARDGKTVMAMAYDGRGNY